MSRPIPDPDLNRALREGSSEALLSGLVSMLNEGVDQWLIDERDLMVAMAPYHHCAQRIGIDPNELFSQAASAGPRQLADAVERFRGRTGISPLESGCSFGATG
jgi:hypothetical protein